MPRKPRPELIDADAPLAGAAWFARARPAAEVLPGLIGEEAARELLKPKRVRPPLESPQAQRVLRKAAVENQDLPIEFIRELLISKNTDRSLAEPFVPGVPARARPRTRSSR